MHFGTSCSVHGSSSLSNSFATAAHGRAALLPGLVISFYVDHVVREAVSAAEAEAASTIVQLGEQPTWHQLHALPRPHQPERGPPARQLAACARS